MEQLAILFGLTFSAAFLASAPPGLLNLNAAQTSVEKGKSNGIMFALGVSLSVMLQVYIAVRIAKYIARNPDVIEVLLKVALVIFAFLAVFFFLKGKKERKTSLEYVEGKKKGSFSKGLFLSAINILAIPYYSGLNTLFHSQGFMTFKIVDEIVFIFSAGSGTFLVMYLYVIYFNNMKRKKSSFSKNSNYILSALMLLLFVITCVRLYN